MNESQGTDRREILKEKGHEGSANAGLGTVAGF
jgi:hypothetical protein